jgi:PAS domain S-box-containing protein
MTTGVLETMQKVEVGEEDYRIMLDESSDAIFKLDCEGCYLYVNFEFANTFGKTPVDIIGKRLWDLFSKEEADMRLRILSSVYATGVTEVFPICVPDPRGDKHFITTAKALFNESHQVVAVICVSKDVTSIRRAQVAEHEALQKLQLISDAVPGVVYQFMSTATGEWKFLYLSRGVTALFEVGVEDALKDSSLLTHCILLEDRESHRESVERSLRDLSEWDHWHRIMTASGLVKWIRGRATPKRQVDGSMVWTGILVDVTERKQIEEAALAANRAKSEFLANMSHEIRTPLSAIAGMANLIRREPLSATQSNRLKKLELAAAHLSSTINDVLDLSKIEANKLVLETRSVDLNVVFANIADMVHDSIEKKGLTLNMAIDPMPQGLIGDPTRLGQALLNYVSNAIKFTQAGTIAMLASVAEQSGTAALVKIEVQDSGVGIPVEKHSLLFNSFVQADGSTTRKYGGSGLGLVITKRFVEAMGGEVGFSSEAGKGSNFWFTVNFGIDTATQASVPIQIADPASTLKNRFSGKRVLLVEDDEFNREIGLILLQEVGLDIDLAEDGKAAVEMAAGNHYDLILMDMQMPILDGLEATRIIRVRSFDTSVPIVAMTANAFFEDRMRCMEVGMNDFLIRPVDPSVLYEVMLRIFEGQRLL